MGVGPTSVDLSRSGLRNGNRKMRGSPDRRAGVFRRRALDGGSALRFGRRLRGVPEGAKTPQSITPDLISQLGVLYIPTVGAKFVYPNLIDQQGVQFRPNIPPKVNPALIENLGVLYQATLPSNQSVSAALISQVGVQYIPTVNSKTVSPQLIDNLGILLQPNIPHKVTPGLISNLGVLYAFGIGVAPELIDQSGELYDVAISSADISPQPALIDQSGVLYDVGVEVAQGQTVSPAFIDQEGVLYQASVRQKTKPLIIIIGVYDPIIEKVGVHDPIISKRGTFAS